MAKSLTSIRSLSSSTHLSLRLNQTENEIVIMFRLPKPSDQMPLRRNRKDPSLRTLDNRFTKILKIFKWGPDAEKALEVLKLRVDHRFVLAVLSIDVDAAVKIKFFKWAGKRRNFQHNSITFMALIRCLDDAGMFGEMWKTIQEMVRNVRAINPTELSEVIRMLGKAKMVNKAVSLFYQVEGHKCVPTARGYNSMILMLMQEGHLEKAHELYSEMCNESECFPDTVTYSALISMFGKLGRDESAIRLFDETKDNGLHLTAKIYTCVLAIFFKLGKVEKALSLAQEMKEDGCPPTVFTYTELIKGLGKAGRVDDAYVVYKNLLKEGCKPDVVLMNNLINIMGKEGCIETAINLFNEMDILRCTPNVVTYNTIIKALFDSKAPGSVAALWFEKMKVNGVIPTSFTYSIMIDGFCKTNCNDPKHFIG